MDANAHPLRLDRSRYFSTIHGEFENAIRHWQDGLPFDAHGQLCAEHCSAEQLAKADMKAPKRPTDDRGRTRDKASDPSSVLCPPSSDSEVNLELWAKGAARYPPFKVFAAIRERYSRSVSTFADAIEFLVNDAKLIPASQASKKLLAGSAPASAREEA
jgi:hypothetical protein